MIIEIPCILKHSPKNFDTCFHFYIEIFLFYSCYFLFSREKLKEILKNTDAHTIEMLSKQNFEYEQQIQQLKERISHLQSSSNVYFEDKDRLLSEMLSRRKVEVRNFLLCFVNVIVHFSRFKHFQ